MKRGEGVNAKTGGNPPQFIFSVAKWQQACGLTRLANKLVSIQKVENGYTEKEIHDYKLFTNHVLNDTLVDQSYRMLDNIKEVNAIPFPEGIPVVKMISAQTEKKIGAEYQAEHLKRLGEKTESVLIDASHFMYQTKAEDICGIAGSFLQKVN